MSQQAVDWFRLLWDMVQRGKSLASIAESTKQNRETVRGYLTGSQPPHWRGELLIELWCDVCGKGKEDVPMCELVLTPRVVTKKGVGSDSEAMDRLREVMR